jgi:predicted kinase
VSLTKTPIREAALLIIVTGPSATGKTLLSQHLAVALDLPVINRDMIKEILFDTLGWRDRAWSKSLGIASYQLLYYCLDLLLSTSHSCIVESNFDITFDTAKLQALIQKYQVTPLQILCRAEPAVLVERFRQRISAGERHPGHVDHLEAAELDSTTVRGWSEPLALEGDLIEFDTSNLETIDYNRLVAQIRRKSSQ